MEKIIRNEMFTIPLTPAEKERIKKEASKRGFTMSTFARYVINGYLNGFLVIKDQEESEGE